MGQWTPVDAVVYNAANAATYADLDLSGTVGANSALCLFGVSCSSVVTRVQLRPKGSTLGEALSVFGDSSTHGMLYTAPGANWSGYACMTDANGILQHCEKYGAGTSTIRLLGYCVLSHPGPVLLDADYIFHESAWLDYDLSPQIGANKSLSMLSYLYVGFPNPTGSIGVLAMRTPGDPRTTEYTGDGVVGGMNRGIIAASGVCGLLGGVITDATGHLEHVQRKAIPHGGLHVQLRHEGSEVTDYVDVQQEIQNTILNEGAWQDLDLSAHVPCRSLCFILVEDGGAGIQSPTISARRKGEVLDFKNETGFRWGPCTHQCAPATGRAGQIEIECSTAGIVDIYAYNGGSPLISNTKFTLLGYILGIADPVISDEVPANGSDINDPTTPLSFRTTDANGDVVQATIDLDLTDPFAVTVNAIINGVFQAGYNGTIVANGDGGFDVALTTHPPFVYGAWTATAYCEDTGARSDTSIWSFDSVHRYRGVSTGALGSEIVYPISGGMKAAGYLWREEFIVNHLVSRNRGTIVGDPSVDWGVTFGSGVQYVSYDGQPPPCQIFIKKQQTWEIIFTPNFAAEDGIEHVFFDADQAGDSLFSLRKQANNSMLVRLGAVDLATVAGDYSADWSVGVRNTLVVSAEDGDASAWLNGVQFLVNDDARWDHRGVDGFFVGTANGLGSANFNGTIHSIRQIAKLITDPAEIS